MNDIGVIFDCDGTLVDSMGAWHEVDRTLAAEAGITLTEADAEAITTMSLPEASAYLYMSNAVSARATRRCSR